MGTRQVYIYIYITIRPGRTYLRHLFFYVTDSTYFPMSKNGNSFIYTLSGRCALGVLLPTAPTLDILATVQLGNHPVYLQQVPCTWMKSPSVLGSLQLDLERKWAPIPSCRHGTWDRMDFRIPSEGVVVRLRGLGADFRSRSPATKPPWPRVFPCFRVSVGSRSTGRSIENMLWKATVWHLMT